MADLHTLQEKLNHDQAERKKFHDDPVGYLKHNGLTLTHDAEKHVESAVKGHTSGGPATPAWSVGVTVGPKAKA